MMNKVTIRLPLLSQMDWRIPIEAMLAFPRLWKYPEGVEVGTVYSNVLHVDCYVSPGGRAYGRSRYTASIGRQP